MARSKHLALLRGINVGGKNRTPIALLCEVASSLGWREVWSHI